MEESKLQDIVNKLTYPKPPPPPTKMQVEDYVQLLNKIMKSDTKVQDAILEELNRYHVQLEKLTEELASKLKEILR